MPLKDLEIVRNTFIHEETPDYFLKSARLCHAELSEPATLLKANYTFFRPIFSKHFFHGKFCLQNRALFSKNLSARCVGHGVIKIRVSSCMVLHLGKI